MEKVAVGHALGLDGVPWAAAWVKARTEAGLNAARDGCLMRAPAGNGSFFKRRLRSSEFVTRLRELLARAAP